MGRDGASSVSLKFHVLLAGSVAAAGSPVALVRRRLHAYPTASCVAKVNSQSRTDFTMRSITARAPKW